MPCGQVVLVLLALLALLYVFGMAVSCRRQELGLRRYAILTQHYALQAKAAEKRLIVVDDLGITEAKTVRFRPIASIVLVQNEYSLVCHHCLSRD